MARTRHLGALLWVTAAILAAIGETPAGGSPVGPTASTEDVVKVWLEPGDGFTDVGHTPLRIGVVDQSADKALEFLSDVTTNVSLATLPGHVSLPITTGAPPPSHYVEQTNPNVVLSVIPSEPLADGWYVMTVSSPSRKLVRLPGSASRAVDRGVAVMFRVGSEPMVESVRECNGQISVDFSESVMDPADVSAPRRKDGSIAYARTFPLDRFGGRSLDAIHADIPGSLVGVSGKVVRREALDLDLGAAESLPGCRILHLNRSLL